MPRSSLPFLAPLFVVALVGACSRFGSEETLEPDAGVGTSPDAGTVDAPLAPPADSGTGKETSTEDAPSDAPVSNDAIPLRPYRYVWVLPLANRAALSSVAAADGLCGANLPSGLGVTKAKALLVGSTRRACQSDKCSGGAGEHLDWPLAPSTEYRRVDGIVVGSTNGLAIFPAGVNASIGDMNTVYAWTGLAPGNTWMTTDTCNDWASTSAAVYGGAAYTGPAYVAAGQPFGSFAWECNQVGTIYCVETP